MATTGRFLRSIQITLFSSIGLYCLIDLIAQVLEHVRLPLCQAKFLVSTVSEDPLVKSDAHCRDLVDEAKNYLLLPLERPNMQGPRTRCVLNCFSLLISWPVFLPFYAFLQIFA